MHYTEKIIIANLDTFVKKLPNFYNSINYHVKSGYSFYGRNIFFSNYISLTHNFHSKYYHVVNNSVDYLEDKKLICIVTKHIDIALKYWMLSAFVSDIIKIKYLEAEY